jgi:hypothetical protein
VKQHQFLVVDGEGSSASGRRFRRARHLGGGGAISEVEIWNFWRSMNARVYLRSGEAADVAIGDERPGLPVSA